MFQKTDFWIGLAVGAVAGVFGYRFMQEREQQMNAIQAAPAGQVPLAELQRQKEELEDLVAAQEAAKAEQFSNKDGGCCMHDSYSSIIESAAASFLDFKRKLGR